MEWNVEWWAYAIIALSVFTGCLLLNYIVNKVNEVQLEERLNILQQKSPAGQVTQVQAPLLEIGERSYPLEERKNNSQHDRALELKAENVQSKPVFLGNIYPELIEVVPIDENTEVDNEGILNDVLYRAMVKVDENKSPVVEQNKT